jgi:hypothetical protein
VLTEAEAIRRAAEDWLAQLAAIEWDRARTKHPERRRHALLTAGWPCAYRANFVDRALLCVLRAL